MPTTKRQKSYFPRYVYLSDQNPNIKTHITGKQIGEQAGVALSSAGRFSNTNYNGLLIGSRLSSVGASYFIEGNKTIGTNGHLNCNNLNGKNGRTFTFPPGIAGGTQVTKVDINADNKTDIVVGAYGFDNSAGTACIAFGGMTTGDNGVPVSLLSLNGTNGFCTQNSEVGSYSGQALIGVDYFGTRYEGLAEGALFAAPGGQTNAGSLFFVESTPGIGKNGKLPLTNSTGVFRRDGIVPGGRLTQNIGVTDLNNDGYGDIAVGVPFTSPNGTLNAGTIYTFLGQPGQDNSVLNITQVPSSHLITMYGTNVNGLCGYSFPTHIADFNGDDLPDLAVGCADGHTHIVWGPLTGGGTVYLSEQYNVTTIVGYPDGGSVIVEAVDRDGDGIDDFVIGSYYGNSANASGNSLLQAGIVDVFEGGDALYHTKTINLTVSDNGIPRTSYMGGTAGGSAGLALIGEDVNGDGCGDLGIGEPSIDGIANIPGGCHLYFGDVSPVLNSISVHIPDGTTIHFNNSNINVTDANHPRSSFTYILANVKNGFFHLASDPLTPITNFTQAQLDADVIRITSTNHLPFSFDIGVNTPGLANLPPQPAPNATWSRTISPEINKATIRHLQGQPPILINEQNIDGSSVYANQNRSAIKFEVQFQNYQFTSSIIDPITNQTIQYPITNGTLGDLSHNMTHGSLVGNGLPSGQLTLTDDAGLSSTTSINFETFRVTNKTVSGLVGADTNNAGSGGSGSTPVCFPLTVNSLDTYINIPGSNPAGVRYDFSGKNVQISLNGSSQAVPSVTKQDVMLQTYCVVSTVNGKPEMNFTATDLVSGAKIGPFAIDFPNFTFMPTVVNKACTGVNAVTQGQSKEITPQMIFGTDNQNTPPTPDSAVSIELSEVTYATVSSTHGGATSTPLTLPQIIQQLNVSTHQITFTPDFSTNTPIFKVRFCGKVCTGIINVDMELKVLNPAPQLFTSTLTATRSTDASLAGIPIVTLNQVDQQGNLVPVPASTLDNVQICWPSQTPYGTIYDIRSNPTPSFNNPPTAIDPVVPLRNPCRPYKEFNSGFIHVFPNGSKNAPEIFFQAFSPAGIPNREGFKSVTVNWNVPIINPTVEDQVLTITRNELKPLKLKGSSPNDIPATLKWKIVSSTGFTYYNNATGTPVLVDPNTFTFTSADMEMGNILYKGPRNNEPPSLTVQLENADGFSTTKTIGINFQRQITPPMITSSASPIFSSVIKSRPVTSLDISAIDPSENEPFATSSTEIEFTTCFPKETTCRITGPNFNQTIDANGTTCVTGMTGAGVLGREYSYVSPDDECQYTLIAINKADVPSFLQKVKGEFTPAESEGLTTSQLILAVISVIGSAVTVIGIGTRICVCYKNDQLDKFKELASKNADTPGKQLESETIGNLIERVTITHSVRKWCTSDASKLKKYRSAISHIVHILMSAGIIYEGINKDHILHISQNIVDAIKDLPVMTDRTYGNKCATYFGCRRELQPSDLGYTENARKKKKKNKSKCCSTSRCTCCGPVEYAVADVNIISNDWGLDGNKLKADADIPIDNGDNSKEMASRHAIVRGTLDKLGENYIQNLRQMKQISEAPVKNEQEVAKALNKLEAEMEALKKNKLDTSAVNKQLETIKHGVLQWSQDTTKPLQPFLIGAGGDEEDVIPPPPSKADGDKERSDIAAVPVMIHSSAGRTATALGAGIRSSGAGSLTAANSMGSSSTPVSKDSSHIINIELAHVSPLSSVAVHSM